jgi:hypothetical protein
MDAQDQAAARLLGEKDGVLGEVEQRQPRRRREGPVAEVLAQRRLQAAGEAIMLVHGRR